MRLCVGADAALVTTVVVTTADLGIGVGEAVIAIVAPPSQEATSICASPKLTISHLCFGIGWNDREEEGQCDDCHKPESLFE